MVEYVEATLEMKKQEWQVITADHAAQLPEDGFDGCPFYEVALERAISRQTN
jgi:hypothetical protein